MPNAPVLPLGPKLRQQAAAAYLGISARVFRTYRANGWVAPDGFLPSARGGRPMPFYLATSLDAAVAKMNDPKSRILSADAISAAKRRRAG